MINTKLEEKTKNLLCEKVDLLSKKDQTWTRVKETREDIKVLVEILNSDSATVLMERAVKEFYHRRICQLERRESRMITIFIIILAIVFGGFSIILNCII